MNTPQPHLLAAEAAPSVFRTTLDVPGFAHFDLGVEWTPVAFRGLLVQMGHALAERYRATFAESLHFVSVSRFDQQSPTRPHRDGGPDASVLLLGYEPTEVPSRLYLMDYVLAARDRGMTPLEYLDCCNPVFGGDERLLQAYVHEVTPFAWGHYQIVVVNNSSIRWEERARGMLGMLHHAVITERREGKSRVIDSLLLGVTEDGLSAEQLSEFVAEAKAATR